MSLIQNARRLLLPSLLCLSIGSGVAGVPDTEQNDFGRSLSHAALERTRHAVTYDGSYMRMNYPGGDVPAHIGVCTDVVIRAYRQLGIDLQKEVHEVMSRRFEEFPNHWGLVRPDTNIDHRRVPNLRRFFELQGGVLPVTLRASDYRPGDLVTWRLGGRLPHIGIVVDPRWKTCCLPIRSPGIIVSTIAITSSPLPVWNSISSIHLRA